MEPLSIAASIINFVDACRVLVKGFKFLKQLSRAPEEIQVLIEELDRLQQILTALDVVTREDRDGSIGRSFSILLGQSERMIKELCEVAGVSFHSLIEAGEGRDKMAKVELRLLNKFKWFRAKRRVGELCETLIVLRLDFTNSLAALNLIRQSQVIVKLSSLSAMAEARQTNDCRIIVHLLGHDAEAASFLENTDSPNSDSINREIRAVENPTEAQEVHSIRFQTKTTFKPSFNRCKLACSCVCHRPYRLRSPAILESITGSVLIRVNGLYGTTRACNEFACSGRSTATIHIAYRFPEWFLDRMVFSVIEKNCHGRINGTLMTPRIVPKNSAIFSRAEAGDIKGVADLLKAGLASPDDIEAQRGFTPLHYAVLRGYPDLCKFLLDAGAHPSIAAANGVNVTDQAMHRVCSKSHPDDVVASLKEIFKYEDWLDERQFSTIHKIALDLLPPRSMDDELEISTSKINDGDSEGRTPVSWAAECGNSSALESLLNHGAKNSNAAFHWSPLHYATRPGSPTCMSLLLDSGASAAATDRLNQTPLHIAASKHGPTGIAPLVEAGADVNARSQIGASPLDQALSSTNTESVEYLIASGADPNGLGPSGTTFLNEKIDQGKHDCVEILLRNGADPTIADDEGNTALHYLARYGDLRTLKTFGGAADLGDMDFHVRNKDGRTAKDIMAQREPVDKGVRRAFQRLIDGFGGGSSDDEFFDAEDAFSEHEDGVGEN